MKLLFDQNLSPRLVARLADLYPNSAHVADLGLSMADDEAVWSFARVNDFMIVSKDADFSEMSLLRGFPPKVVWIQRGNCSTDDIEEMLRNGFSAIEALDRGTGLGILLLHLNPA